MTCSLNFSCPEYEIKLKWSLDGLSQYTSVISTSLNPEAVSTQSKLTFEPLWAHHGKNLTCQLWNDIPEGLLLSQETVQLDVKRKSPHCSCGKDKGLGPFSPTPQSTQGSRNLQQEGSVISLCVATAGNGSGKAVFPFPPSLLLALVCQETDSF